MVLKIKRRAKQKDSTPQRCAVGSVRIQNREGRWQVEGLGMWYHFWRDPYHFMLLVPWWGFFTIISIGYVLINVWFALLYLLGGDSLTGAQPGSFTDAFFFSVQTLGSIGYGVISPKTTYANIIVMLEAITSLLLIAIVTGLSFARFARPTARVVFSQVAVVAPYHNVPTLMLRAANKRRNQLLEAEVRLYFLRDEISPEGTFMRRFYELPTTRSRTPSFTLTWTIMHPIDEQSPLYLMTPELLEKVHGNIIVSLTGLDETVNYMMTSRHTYVPQNVLWDHQFVDIFYKSPTGDRYVNYTNFHSAMPLEVVGDRQERVG